MLSLLYSANSFRRTCFPRAAFKALVGTSLPGVAPCTGVHALLLKASYSADANSEIKRIDYMKVNDNDNLLQHGDYKLLASQHDLKRIYANGADLGTGRGPEIGQLLWLRGRVNSVRVKGNACFIVLRCGTFNTVQAVHFKDKDNAVSSKALIKFISGLALESIIDIQGILTSADVKSCTQSNIELQIRKAFVVSRTPAQLPFLLEDAAHSQFAIDASQGTDRPIIGVSQDARLNNRWLDLRVPSSNAIMRLRSGVSHLFREALLNKGFVEIQTPKLIPGESEGGSEVFRTDYFGTPACLAQSPQLYKQMAISGDLDRVFEVGPVFRAEKSLTTRHLCEFTGLDMEMAIKFHYNEALEVVHYLFKHIFENLEEKYNKELAVVREQFPSEPVMFTEDPLIIHWPEAMQMLADAGYKVDVKGDLTRALELALGGLVKTKYGADFFALDQYPSAVRPFYTMPNPDDDSYSNSYDLFLRGQEICSGAQRCHEPDLLCKRIQEKGLNLEHLQSYVESFRHGVSPHAGAGIGLDRVVFLYLGLDNVRKASMFPRDPNRIVP